jgi:uncharacterized integral membrane protein
MLLRLLLLSPLLLVLVVFALANPQPLHIVFWPFEAAFDGPASLVLLGVLGAGLLMGAVMVWVTTLGLRLRARRAERACGLLEAEVRRAKVAGPMAVLEPPA